MNNKKSLIAMAVRSALVLAIPSFAFAGDVEIQLPAASDAFTVDQPAGTELMRVNGNGNVGIGTDTPAVKFHVQADGTAPAFSGSTDRLSVVSDGNTAIQVTGGTTGNSAVMFSDPDSRSPGALDYDHNNDAMRFRVNESIRAVIDSEGKVGIGTTAPASILDILNNVASVVLRDGDAAINEPGHQAGLQLYDGSGNRTGVIGFSTSFEGISIRNFNDDGGIGFSTGGNANQVTIAADGNVGIGATTPSSELHISDNDGDNVGQLILSGGTSGNGSLKSHTVDSNQLISLGPLGIPEALNIRNINGYVGINNTNPQRSLHVTGGVQADNTHGSLVLKRNENYTAVGHGNGLIGGLSPKDNLLGYFGYTNTTVDPDDPQGRFFIQVDTNNDQINQTTEHHFNVLHTGNVGIGTITPMHPLEMGSGAHVTAAGVWTNASDISKKENIKEINYGLDTVMKLKPSEYDYKTDNSHSIGFIAQEIEKIVPEVVSGADGSKGVAYGSLTAVLVKAMQQQQAQIAAQQKRIEALEAKLQ